MAESKSHRLRLRLPSGAEMEAEGTPDFVAGERREFAALFSPRPAGEGDIGGIEKAVPSPIEPPWEEIIETRGHNIQLRAKLGGGQSEKEACLVLIAASRALLRTPRPTAAQLARWLRLSGYPVARVDRTVNEAIVRGDMLASGSRRARRYELSGPGLAKALNLGRQLERLIKPA